MSSCRRLGGSLLFMAIRSVEEPFILPPARSSYDDWLGTACAENSMVTSGGDLYELAGLDRDRWLILAIDMGASSHGKPPSWTVRVYAADRGALGFKGVEDLEAIAQERGNIPVVDILLHDVNLDDVIKCMKLIGIQLRNGHLQQPLLVTGRADYPEQD